MGNIRLRPLEEGTLASGIGRIKVYLAKVEKYSRH